MIIRLKINGFKNLINADIRFGTFTCIAGANGVGKSNLFDAIRFLSALASQPLTKAAASIRSEGGSAYDLKNLFHRIGNKYADRMTFEVEMIVPRESTDDFGQKGKATNTMLRYFLELGYCSSEHNSTAPGSMEILKEELSHIKKGEAGKHLLFEHSKKDWRDTLVKAGRRVPYFISTEGHGESRIIKLHQDGGSSGRPWPRSASNLPRTVLSAANAAESPTVLCARREMESWRILQLEPSALRMPDDINAPSNLTLNGGHLPATLYRLAHSPKESAEEIRLRTDPEAIFAKIANRLSTLIGDVSDVWIDRDDRREILTLQVIGKDGTEYPARSLSDGTLRFLALCVLEQDVDTEGVICLEEPENGIHPERVPAMLNLLQDIAVDPTEAVDETNPLRQVIVNTHSPAVVSEVPDGSLIVAETKEDLKNAMKFKKVNFSCLSGTWREKAPNGTDIVSKGKLLAYLNPSSPSPPDLVRRQKRVVDREDLQRYIQELLPFEEQRNG
jgi:predicted ATPase